MQINLFFQPKTFPLDFQIFTQAKKTAKTKAPPIKIIDYNTGSYYLITKIDELTRLS